jgi:hypothetical protein
MTVDLSRFASAHPEYSPGFWLFAQGLGFLNVCNDIDSICIHKGILPPDREEMEGIFYQYLIDKYLVWDPRDEGMKLEKKLEAFRNVLEQVRYRSSS